MRAGADARERRAGRPAYEAGPLGEALFVAPLEDADQDGEVEECTGAPVPAHNAAKLATGDSKPYNRLARRLRHPGAGHGALINPRLR